MNQQSSERPPVATTSRPSTTTIYVATLARPPAKDKKLEASVFATPRSNRNPPQLLIPVTTADEDLVVVDARNGSSTCRATTAIFARSRQRSMAMTYAKSGIHDGPQDSSANSQSVRKAPAKAQALQRTSYRLAIKGHSRERKDKLASKTWSSWTKQQETD